MEIAAEVVRRCLVCVSSPSAGWGVAVKIRMHHPDLPGQFLVGCPTLSTKGASTQA